MSLLLNDLSHQPHNPAALTGVLNRLAARYELRWIAGSRGKPGINADINSATEATREIADPDFELLGTNAVSADSAYYAEGGIALSTHGASADSTILLPHLDANQSAWTQVTWGTDKAVEWDGYLSTAANIASIEIWAGLKLTNTPTVATDDNQAFFRFDPATNGGRWQAVYSIAGVDVSVDTGITVAASTKYRFRVRFDTSRVPYFYINDELVATGTAMTDAIDLIPYIGVKASAAAVKTIYVFGESISRSIG